MLTANASDLPDRSRTYGETSSQLSRSQISGTPRASPGTSKSSSLATNQVAILFLRGDGGDPKELQVENTLWYTSRCEMGLAASIRMATRLALIPQFRRAPDKLRWHCSKLPPANRCQSQTFRLRHRRL